MWIDEGRNHNTFRGYMADLLLCSCVWEMIEATTYNFGFVVPCPKSEKLTSFQIQVGVGSVANPKMKFFGDHNGWPFAHSSCMPEPGKKSKAVLSVCFTNAILSSASTSESYQ